MRVAVTVALGLALAVTVTSTRAPALPQDDGLPRYIDDYAKWPKLNRKPITGGSPAHQGTKNVYASRRKPGARYPIGTTIVKTATPPGRRWLSLVATMRRIKASSNGGWRWAEYTRTSASTRFTKIAFPESGCAACHVQAKTNDYVFTRR